MFNERLWTHSSRRLLVLLLAVSVPPAATLLWLGWQLVAQDRTLLAQRELEQRQVLVQAAIHSLELSLIDAERLPANEPVPDGSARFTWTADAIRVEPADRVLWTPSSSAANLELPRRFASLDALEFRGQRDQAVPEYERLTRSSDSTVRAEAFLRIGRIHWRSGRWDAALRAYRELATITDVAIDGAPADLQARRAACDVLQEAKRTAELADQAGRLRADFLANRWAARIDRPTWELTAADLERWTGQPLAIAADRKLYSAVADVLWNDAHTAGQKPARQGRRLIVADGAPVTLLQPRPDVALAISPALLRSWLDRAAAASPLTASRITALGGSGDAVEQAPVAASEPAFKVTAAETGLPWTLGFTMGDSSLPGDMATRRRLLFVGLGAILLLITGGSYFLWRVVRRELAVGRQQTEFVATVSHEFRTPLTSLKHLTELLQESDELPRDRRQSFYESLGRNTERLQRLVESLLDFARMEGGRKPYDLQPIDAAQFTAEVVRDFQGSVSSAGLTITLDVSPAGPTIVRADTASLTNAIWNVLDNAVKYSTAPVAIVVSVRRRPEDVAIAIRDRGLGIPAAEQKDIFRRFARGRTAVSLGIKGTGLGLAMVSHIVRAHGGAIQVESTEGEGSTFTLVLPLARGAAVRAARAAEPNAALGPQ